MKTTLESIAASASRMLAFGIAATLLAALGSCAGSARPPENLAAQQRSATQTAREAETAHAGALMARANAAYANGNIVSPAGDSAIELFLLVRAAMPGNPVAADALIDMLPAAMDAADAALNRADNEEARRILDLLERAAPGSLAARDLRAELDALQAARPVAAKAQAEPASRGARAGSGGGVSHASSAH